jgi:hypothetical protein
MTTTKERKKISRLKREIEELELLAYKHDMDESFSIAGDKLNSRYKNKVKELKMLSK